MLPLHMIHRSVGQLCSKFTCSAELPSSNCILKFWSKYKLQYPVQPNAHVHVRVQYVPKCVLTFATVFHTLHIQCHCQHVHPCRAPTGNPWSQDLFHTVHALSTWTVIVLMNVPVVLLQAGLSLKLFPTPCTHLVVSVSCHSCIPATCSCVYSCFWAFSHSSPIWLHCTHFYFHFYPMTSLDMKPQMAIVLCSVVTISTVTFCPFMLPLHMIHRSVGQLCSNFTFSAELPSSNRILKKNWSKYKL